MNGGSTMRVKVCMGTNCTLLGAMNILDSIEDLKDIIEENNEEYNEDELHVEAVKCLNYCKETKENIAPVVVIDDEVILNATSQEVMEKIVLKKKI